MKKNKIIFIGIILIISYGYYFLSSKFGFSIPCVFHEITGFYCPGCGVTRMIFSIIKLDFYQAFRYNPLLFILSILYIIFVVERVIRKKDYKVSNKAAIVILVILILYAVARNIPAFSYLAPTVVR